MADQSNITPAPNNNNGGDNGGGGNGPGPVGEDGRARLRELISAMFKECFQLDARVSALVRLTDSIAKSQFLAVEEIDREIGAHLVELRKLQLRAATVLGTDDVSAF